MAVCHPGKSQMRPKLAAMPHALPKPGLFHFCAFRPSVVYAAAESTFYKRNHDRMMNRARSSTHRRIVKSKHKSIKTLGERRQLAPRLGSTSCIEDRSRIEIGNACISFPHVRQTPTSRTKFCNSRLSIRSRHIDGPPCARWQDPEQSCPI